MKYYFFTGSTGTRTESIPVQVYTGTVRRLPVLVQYLYLYEPHQTTAYTCRSYTVFYIVSCVGKYVQCDVM